MYCRGKGSALWTPVPTGRLALPCVFLLWLFRLDTSTCPTPCTQVPRLSDRHLVIKKIMPLGNKITPIPSPDPAHLFVLGGDNLPAQASCGCSEQYPWGVPVQSSLKSATSPRDTGASWLYFPCFLIFLVFSFTYRLSSLQGNLLAQSWVGVVHCSLSCEISLPTPFNLVLGPL